jgi:hypothetical protein
MFGYSAEDVKEHPVILREEYPASGRKGFAPRFCGRKKLSMLCRQALSEARIPPNIVNLVDKDAFFEADLNESLGDIFKSNFRTRANHTCALTAGELCYITGTKSKRTYDEYYADYSSSLSQESIRFALDEWTDRYLPMIHGDARKIRGLTLLVDAKDEDIYLKLSNLFGMRIDEMCSAR